MKPKAAVLVACIGLGGVTLPGQARADLRLHLEGGGLAPISRPLRTVGAGFAVGGSLDYEIVDLLALGAFYAFGFLKSDNDEITDDTLDHAAGARLDLRFVRHRRAGWFGSSSGRAYGEAFMELDLAYHNLARQHRVGWAFGMGYRTVVAGPFGLGPVFRLRHTVAPKAARDNRHQLYVFFGLDLFFTFDVRRRPEERPGPEAESGAQPDGFTVDPSWNADTSQ